jgi:A/G-specific adenine glycosylase
VSQTARDELQCADLTSMERFQAMVLGWYADNARQFVWRTPNPDPFVVLVSETMLQQTQTHRVQQKLSLFLQQFPDFAALAAADNASIIRAWQGMGYNNRALRLRDCARTVLQVHNGVLPADAQALGALPGIGPYTVSAVLSFAFHHDVPVLDVNIRRLYSRVFQRLNTVIDLLSESALQLIARDVFPRGRSSEWHQACMDIAAQFCTARSPRCLLCPVCGSCRSAYQLADAAPVHIQEPSFRGQPNRIWRGRIVELLRGLEPGQELSHEDLRTVLLLRDTLDDAAWIGNLLSALERDGLIRNGPTGICLQS